MDKSLWMIYVTHMFLEAFLLVRVAIIPVIVNEFSLNLLEASLVVSVPSFAALLMFIPSGLLADRLRTGHLLSASMFIEGTSFLIISQTSSFWVLVAGTTLMRISSPIYHIVGLSQISKLAEPKKISKSLGFHNALGCLGQAAGLMSLTFSLSTTGWRSSYLLWSLPIFIWGFVLLFFAPQAINETKAQEHERQTRADRYSRLSVVFSSAFLACLLTVAFWEVGAGASTTFMTTYFVNVRNLSEVTASLIFGIGPLIGILGSLGGGYIGERLTDTKAISSIIACCAISLLALSLTYHFYLLILFYLVYAFFNNAYWSPMNALVARISPRAYRGMSYSVFFFSEGVVASFTPLMAASLIESSSVWHVLPFSVVFLIMATVVLQLLRNSQRKKGGRLPLHI